MDNLDIYEKVRKVPQEAQKSIGGGRLKGMTDINPMWRIKMLTETFGICGIGWKYEIVKKHLETASNGEVAAFVDINLYFKHETEWSEAIPGTGGSSFITNERNGLYVSDECFKMALTDAISIACKALGFGADIYWQKGTTKYTNKKDETPQTTQQSTLSKTVSEAQIKRLYAIAKTHNVSNDDVLKVCTKLYKKEPKKLTKIEYDAVCARLEKKVNKPTDKQMRDLTSHPSSSDIKGD